MTLRASRRTTLHGAKVVDPAREFAPVIQLTAQPIVLRESVVASVDDVRAVELPRRKPGDLA